MSSILLFCFVFTLCILLISFSVYKKLRGKGIADQNDPPTLDLPLAGLCSYPDSELVADSDQGGKKKKKRPKKKKKEKRLETVIEEESTTESEKDKKGTKPDPNRVETEMICLYPFTSSGSATQRKIKQQYDELMKCHESKGLTLAQVGFSFLILAEITGVDFYGCLLTFIEHGKLVSCFFSSFFAFVLINIQFMWICIW